MLQNMIFQNWHLLLTENFSVGIKFCNKNKKLLILIN